MGGAPRSHQTGAVDRHFVQRSDAAVRSRRRRRRDDWDPAGLGAGRERPRLRRDPERRVQYLAAAAHRGPARADHALQRRKNLQLRVVTRWPMAVARQRRQQKRRRPNVTPALAFTGRGRASCFLHVCPFGCVFDCGHSCKKQDLTPRARASSQLEASERVAGASTAGLVPDQNPAFHKLLDVPQRGIG